MNNKGELCSTLRILEVRYNHNSRFYSLFRDRKQRNLTDRTGGDMSLNRRGNGGKEKKLQNVRIEKTRKNYAGSPRSGCPER